MADLSITAGDVLKITSTANIFDGISGGTITAGMACYVDSTDSDKVKPADADSSSLTASVKGVALNGASSGQPVRVQLDGTIDIGATVTQGEIYVLSGNAGGIAPEADLATGDYVSIIGVGSDTANQLELAISNSGKQIP